MRCRRLAGLRLWESVTHPHSEAGYHLLPTRGNLAPMSGLCLWAPSLLLGVLGLGKLLSQRASVLGSGCWPSSSFQLGGIERTRGNTGLLCMSINWLWRNIQGKFRCQMPLLEVHLKCLVIEQPQ